MAGGADLPHIGLALASAGAALLAAAPEVVATAGFVVAVDDFGLEGLMEGFVGGARSRREEETVDAAFFTGADGAKERWLAVEAPLSTLEDGRFGPSVSFGAGTGGGGIGIRLGPVEGSACELDAAVEFAVVVIRTR